ncbi:hypothetical protein [Aureimonas psammosilenae]|uniref:hypothetical protein n=1 Tax=Aureimonas psammosilenae TaxID=2495496 RepID=UPI0012604099|nr:hypothetical protein [Aureimonas psammosilenae]
MSNEFKSNRRYAVLFRTHVWDEFAKRQYQRLLATNPSGDVFIVANNTSGAFDNFDDPALFAFSTSSLAALDLPNISEMKADNPFWYNIDYPLYMFAKAYGGYDYYVVVEYDVGIEGSIDRIVEDMARSGYDSIGYDSGQPMKQWGYRKSAVDFYEAHEMRKELYCFSVFSARALAFLYARRVEMGRLVAERPEMKWPHCEIFIPTELAKNGFSLVDLSRYGRTDRYDFQPAVLEDDVHPTGTDRFLHPVLDRERSLQNIIKYEYRPERFFYPRSAFRRRLKRFQPHEYRSLLRRSLNARMRKVYGRLAASIVNVFVS